MTSAPIVEFIRLIPQAKAPKRADRSGAGFLPSRALRYCDALTSATGFGYWVFPPLDIQLLWDGEQIFWAYAGVDGWLTLSSTETGAVQFPDFGPVFDERAPEGLRGYSPPFLTALPEAGALQIWTGLLARSRPGWSIMIRPPANLPPTPGLAAWEGIVETDIWFGPLFTNLRLTRTDQPVAIRAGVPLIQVQPIPQLAYRDETLSTMALREADAMTPAEWQQLGEVLLPSPDPEARQGEYAVTVRKRRACPVDHTALTPSASQKKI